MLNFIKSIPEHLTYLISPPYCQYCKQFIQSRSIFCKNCFDKINPIVSLAIPINKNYTLKVYAISQYDEPLKSLILSKINRNFLASQQIAELIYEFTNLNEMEVDYFVPVPLHWLRFIKRGYNQAEAIASVLSQKKERPVVNILNRYKYTKYQSSLVHHLKFENVKNAFKINTSNYQKFNNKDLIIVDDLMTSGSTLISAAKQLIKLNPKSISAVVACRVI